MSVLSGFPARDDGPDGGADDRARAVDARVEEMLASPEALMEGLARTDAGHLAGPEGDAVMARFLADQPDPVLASYGRALLRGERPVDLAASDEFEGLVREGIDRLRETDGREVVRVVAEHDRGLQGPGRR